MIQSLFGWLGGYKKSPTASHNVSLCPYENAGISDHLLETAVLDPDYRDFRFATTGVINGGMHKTILSDGIFTAAK